MKAFICLLALATSANAGILLGELSGGGAGVGGGYALGGGYEHSHGHVQEASIIKVIHEQSAGFSGHHEVVPSAIIKVIHEGSYSSGHGHHHHQHLEAVPQIVQVLHEDHGHAISSGPVVHHVKVIHEHAGGDIGAYVSAGHGDIAGIAHSGGEIAGVVHGGAINGGGYTYGVGHDHSHGGAQEVKVIKVIQEDPSHHHHHHHESHGWA